MNVAIIGIGLIGGSMAIDLKESGFATNIIGVDISQENLDKALRRRIIDEAASLEEAIQESALIILSIPVNTALTVLPLVLDNIDEQAVIEVGSTKVELLKLVNEHPRRGNLISIHPMAGTEFSGPEAAMPRLFQNETCVIVEAEKSEDKYLALCNDLLDHLEMRSVEYGANEHDLHAAYVSHISHISSFALALTVLAKEKDENRIFELASGGFSSTVRLAKSNSKMWVPIFKQNRDNVLDVLDEHINSLASFRTMLIKKDFEGLEKLIHKANEIKRILQ